MIRRTRLGQRIVVLALAALILAGCGLQRVVYVVASPTPTPVVITVVVTSAPVPPAAVPPTPTPVPPTSTPVPPTPTPAPSTSTPVPPTPRPPSGTLVIKDKSFTPEDCVGTTVLEITAVKGESFSISVIEGSLSIRGGRMTIWCKGIEHRWLGKLSYANHTFDSAAGDPLRFLLVAGGYEYIGGTGTVTLPDGKEVTLP